MALDLDSKFEKLIKRQADYKSANLACNLLISRLQKKYAANQTPVELKSCIKEMTTFFEKYNALLAKEIEVLKNL